MRSMKKLGTAVAAASLFMAMTGAGSASAANWDPANTTLTAHGTLTLDQGTGSVTCTYHSSVRSTGNDVAFTANSAGAAAPPTFSSCSTNLGASAHVTSSSAWNITANSTTTATVSNGNAVITLTAFGADICTITASGVTVDATWSNATSTLTPSAQTFNVTQSGSVCPGGTGVKSARMTGSVSVPGASIT